MYLIDANVLITAKNQYYPIQGVPEFWEWLVYKGSSGALKMPLEILEEITDSKDELAQWIKQAEHYDALCLGEEINRTHVQTVLNKYASDLNDTEIIEIGRDPFLIAYALSKPHDRTVVTVEISRPSQKRANRKIPDVCRDVNVKCCNIFMMLSDLGFTTNWKSKLIR